MLNAAAPGTSKQQLKFFIPGIVERTAAPNPETIAGKYFLKFIDSFFVKVNFQLHLKYIEIRLNRKTSP